MFNRQPYNRGKYNVSSGAVGNSGIGLMILATASVNAMRTINASGIASINMKSSTEGTNVKYDIGIANIIIEGQGEGTKVFIVNADIANMVITTEAKQTLAGESVITLENLDLKPGDEIIINTCDMTVTKNGQNAIEYFSSDSEFFNLLSGLNTLVYSDTNSNREISFDVIWKDRWL